MATQRERERSSERMGEISLVIDKNGWFDLFGSVEWSAAYRSKIIIIALITRSLTTPSRRIYHFLPTRADVVNERVSCFGRLVLNFFS